MNTHPVFKVAVAHVAPVYLDLQRSIEKTCSLINEAADGGAQLIAFPEAYLPAFPVWSALRSPIYNHDLFCRSRWGEPIFPATTSPVVNPIPIRTAGSPASVRRLLMA